MIDIASLPYTVEKNEITETYRICLHDIPLPVGQVFFTEQEAIEFIREHDIARELDADTRLGERRARNNVFRQAVYNHPLWAPLCACLALVDDLYATREEFQKECRDLPYLREPMNSDAIVQCINTTIAEALAAATIARDRIAVDCPPFAQSVISEAGSILMIEPITRAMIDALPREGRKS